MNYIVIEIQTNGGTTSHIVTAHSTRESAESKFHQVLAAAAVSSVEDHAAVLIAQNGTVVRTEHYTHAPAVEE